MHQHLMLHLWGWILTPGVMAATLVWFSHMCKNTDTQMKWLWHYEGIVTALIKPFSFWQRNIVYQAIAEEIISLCQIEVKGEENEKMSGEKI